ncbi:glycosyltransferase [Mycolicibacterium arenosum]|uniref:Glycosyltransferase n=1 Tax=Mycolicibacterium arenosum TaxID=2952157 RepID=A0ABT1M3Q4_9MYCO|nr:glycosyltransferase [Mycolicibacterium sp. CAU 1645]MCP9273790.1 glycosyltransferase [Mycolicibacterium sp. CAU 1645]
MTRPTVCFLLSKDPVLEHGGDVAMFRLIVGLAAHDFDVSAVCLSRESGTAAFELDDATIPLIRVRKPEINPAKLLFGAVRARRSLVHVRFDCPELVSAIDATDAQTYVAEHSYMAESFLRSTRFGHRRLVVNTHVPEALVWRATRGALGRLEVPRLKRDELRVARSADAVATFDADEAAELRAQGVADARWLDLRLPPVPQVDIAATPRRLVLMGTRDWPPNQEAFLHAIRLWPAIADGIDGAELCIIGAKKPGAAEVALPDGVRDLGFVDDLEAFLTTCRAMIAPIRTGGGVRVKLLDAIRMGLPVVGTAAAVGSLNRVFDLGVFDDDDAFVAQCRRMLLDVDAAVTAGRATYRANSEYWREARGRREVATLILGRDPDSPHRGSHLPVSHPPCSDS